MEGQIPMVAVSNGAQECVYSSEFSHAQLVLGASPHHTLRRKDLQKRC